MKEHLNLEIPRKCSWKWEGCISVEVFVSCATVTEKAVKFCLVQWISRFPKPSLSIFLKHFRAPVVVEGYSWRTWNLIIMLRYCVGYAPTSTFYCSISSLPMLCRTGVSLHGNTYRISGFPHWRTAAYAVFLTFVLFNITMQKPDH